MISFTCNICGTGNALEEIPWEEPTCSGCGSNVRMRALIYMLSIELFGAARTLPEFPKDKKIRGFGLSDALLYATPLEEKFDYTNTYYDRQPYLDITQPHPEQYGTYDFILSSDVFEHVAIPVERAFEEAFRLLKPHGVLCITVPSSAADEDTVEYYPNLHEYSIVELGGEHVLVNRKKDRTLEVHQNLEFHGGIGATLVMRQFSQRDMAGKLRGAGFAQVEYQTESVPQFGIVLVGNWSLPLVARKVARAPGAVPMYNPPRAAMPVWEAPAAVQETPAAVAAEAEQAGNPQLENQISRLHNEKAALERRLATLENRLNLAADSRWLKLGQKLGLGPKLR